MWETPEMGRDEMKPGSADAELRLREWEPETFRSPLALKLQLFLFFSRLKTSQTK